MENNIINAEYRTAETIIAEVKATIEHVETTAMLGAIKIGKCYMELKELIPHGGWYKFIEENTGHSPKKVERFMKIAAEFGDESTPLGSLFSKTTISSDLSIYKALTLIALPDEEVESFVENNDIASMTVKELEEKIKALQDENEAIGMGYEKLVEDSVEAEKEKDRLLLEVQELKDKLADLEAAGANAEGGISEEAQKEIDKAKKELEKAENKAKSASDKAEKLQKDIDQLKAAQEKAIEEAKAAAIEEGKQLGKKENEEELLKQKQVVEEAVKMKQEAEKKLAASANADVMKVKFCIDQMQLLFGDAIQSIENIEINDQEQAGKLRGGLHAILGQMQGRL
jgi:DNA repair exonuclease SbcCD ATPase subunit